MPLAPGDLAALCAEASRALFGARVQKLWCPARGACVLQLRTADATVFLLVRAGAAHGRLSTLAEKPALSPQPPAAQALFRRHLEGAALEGARLERDALVLRWSRGPQAVVLVATLTGPGALAVAEEGRVRALDAPRGTAPPELLPGKPFAAPDAAAPPSTTAPARLAALPGPLGLLRAAEVLVGESERQAASRDAASPLKKKRDRLVKTLAKVKADLERTAEAEGHRLSGELLKRNLHLLRRGQEEVLLVDYDAAGEVVQRTVKLDPARPPSEQADRHFHQYKRLQRGMQMAGERYARLTDELAALEQRLAADPAPAARFVEPREAAEREGGGPSRPYREYQGSNGVKLLVGKGPAQNDALTFHHAQPHHVWLHARGVGGAHVVVPVEKGAELPQEALLDAAHLALHHSALKGEPRGEVSWTFAKFVKKPRGAAPGAVTYTRDRTFWVRVEPERLARLIATER